MSAKKQYVYQRLGDSGIRLLHVQKRIQRVKGDATPSMGDWEFQILSFDDSSSAPAYNTVSYVWGDSSLRWTLPLRDGTHLAITESIQTALPYLCEQCVTSYLWIDQLSINQNDIEERNRQVQGMGQIYAKAQSLIIWLGLPDTTVHSLVDLGIVFSTKEKSENISCKERLQMLTSGSEANIRFAALLNLFK